ncbi:hypothetical protein LSUE1_G009243 [Lachnellula suecica]|uniref:Uncharacterized protein n=1 Tax=Lachnellula suecica TaxID=602035 RepID=A0A8T9BZ12_9HELO|nr:hypothetical protein LSUE1_G009243 [Lachnellula suecica]
MSDDTITPEPSLVLAGQENAHREQQQQQHHHEHDHRRHQLRHNHQHRREAGTTVQDISSVVTEVVATVSYLQQIDVDSKGSTFSVQTVLASPTASTTDASTSASAALATTTPAASSYVSEIGFAASSTNSTQSLISSSSQQITLSEASSSAALSSATTFSNSSTSSTSLSSSSRSSLTYLTSSSSTDSSTSSSSSSSLSSTSSSTSSESSSTTSTSSLYSPSSSSYQPTSTGAGGIGAGGTGATSGATPSSTGGSGNNSDSGSATSTTPQVLGGVLGGLAGLALIGFLLLLLIKWYRRKHSMLPLGNGNEGSITDQVRDAPPSQPSGGMVQRRSLAFAVPAALASLAGYNKRSSQRTQGTVSSTAGSERGFYRVSGRKLPSVLQTGGDGYGGGVPGVHDSTMSGSSFYRDSTGFYGGPGSPPPSSVPFAPERDRDSGVPVMRPSPARTPVTEHGPFGPSVVPPPPTLTPPPPRRPDGLGRSHPSQDGSHASRFTEEV